MRAERAKEIYKRAVRDMDGKPERREYYKEFVERMCIENDKKIPDDLDKPFVCRGSFRAKLVKEDKPYIYDRIAAMYVSLTVTNHWRVDTTIEHYLTK